MAEEKNKVEDKEYKAVQVPTQYAPAVQSPDEELITTEQALAEILNRLDELKSLIG